MFFTKAEIEQLCDAVDNNDLNRLTALMKAKQAELNAADSTNIFKHAHPFYMACHEGLNKIVEFYLSSNQCDIDEITLYNGLHAAVMGNQPNVVSLLLSKYNLDPNYILPGEKTTYYSDKPFDEARQCEFSLLVHAMHKDDDNKMLRCLLRHSTVAVNLQWNTPNLEGVTALYQMTLGDDPHALDKAKLLLEHGANPVHPMVLQAHANPSNKPVNLTLLTMMEVVARSRKGPKHKEFANLFKSYQGRVAQPTVDVHRTPARRTFLPSEADAALDFMDNYHYQNTVVNEQLKGLHQLVVACMEGKAFLSIVECLIANNHFETNALYQGIYLASWFDNHKAIELIFNNCDSHLDPDLAIKIMNQGKADCAEYRRRGSHKGKTLQLVQLDALNKSNEFFVALFDGAKHEHSSDEEQLAGTSSPSPGHSSDSDDPKNAGSDNSPPNTPPKLITAKKPLSERARSLIEEFGVDQGLSLSYKIDLQKEICDQGLTFTYFDEKNKNVFHRFVISRKFEIASYILTLYPEAVNSRNSDGRTALHLDSFFDNTSFEESSLEIINFLLGHNADPTIKDNHGKTADYYADQKKFYKCAQYLRDKMVEYEKAHTQVPLLSRLAEISHVSPAVPSRPLPPAPAVVSTAVLTSSTSPALFRVQGPVAAASTSSAPPASKSGKPAAIGSNRGNVISQPPVDTIANKQFKEKQGLFSKFKKLIPGSSTNNSDVNRSLSPGVQP